MTTKVKNKHTTKRQVIVELYKDKLINERVLWGLLGSRFKKAEIEQMDKLIRVRKK